MHKRLIKSSRTLFSLALLGLFFFLQEKPIPSSNEPIQLYASVCHDNLQKIYLNAIEGAQESIYLVMYSLSDDKVIKALNKKAQKGVAITVVHDTSTPQKGYERLVSIKRVPIVMSGLMHQKILVVDNERIWIGSANFTTDSLRLHDNLVARVTSPELSQNILAEDPTQKFKIGGQLLEFYNLPKDKKKGLARLIDLIDHAEHSVRVAMYTWTHPDLTEAVIRAHNRGVTVEIILDRGQANGVGRKATKALVDAGVAVWLSSGQKLLHHKCFWLDENILINGSTNWTRAAFTKNKDCFFILHDLTEDQKDKMRTLWKRTRILSKKEHPRIETKKSTNVQPLDIVQVPPYLGWAV